MLGWIEGFSVVRSVAKQVRLETVLMASQGRMVAISFPAFECDCYFVFIHSKRCMAIWQITTACISVVATINNLKPVSKHMCGWQELQPRWTCHEPCGSVRALIYIVCVNMYMYIIVCICYVYFYFYYGY